MLLNPVTLTEVGRLKQFAEFCLDPAEGCLWRSTHRIELAPKPFAVLQYLVERAGHLVTHDQLLDALWPETYVQPQVLRTYMLDLRRILGDNAREPRFIESLPKRGYRFIAPVHESRDCRSAPPIQAGVHSSHFVGRTSELRSLEQHLSAAELGTRQIVLLRGEAGIGKTTLLDEFCRQSEQDRNAVIGFGQCLQGFAARQDYYPVLDALERLCSTSQLRQRLSSDATAWSQGLTSHSAPGQQKRPGDLCAALESLAQEQLIILALEDLQWADQATLDLLSAIARRRGPAKLLVLATFTQPIPAESRHLRSFTQDLAMRRLGTEIAIPPLEKASVAKVVAGRLGVTTVPAALAELLHMRSEGNPLIAFSILDHLIAQGMLSKSHSGHEWQLTNAAQQADADVPHELSEMIELELERMQPNERRLLEAGSLMNIAFPAWAVAAALDLDLAETEEACDDLARRFSCLRRAGVDELPDGTQSSFYVFAHGLYREALYRRQPAARRAERHLRIADRLKVLFAGREELIAEQAAMHYEAGCHWRRALDILRIAEDRAKARNADSLASHLRSRSLNVEEQWKTRLFDPTCP